MKEFTINASSDGLDLAVALVEPEGNPKGLVQFVHGMCEHKERYYPFMEWLAAEGYACVIHDNRGHGASVRTHEDLGYMYDGGWKAMVEDVKVVGDWARARYPGLKFTLFGHSMGSMVVRSYAKRYDDTLDRLFICGSPSDNPAKGAGKALAAITGILRGWHYRSRLMLAMSFGTYNKPFEGECDADGRPYHSAWVCSNKKILDEYHKDPLCQFIFTANGYYNLMGLMEDCYSRNGWKVGNPALPIRFISGADDPCRISDKDFAKAVRSIEDAGYSNVGSKLYPGMRHEILNETDMLTVWNDVLKALQ